MTGGHTPGPWHAVSETVVAVGQPAGYNVGFATNYPGRSQQIANVRLMAEAPELLRLLTHIVTTGPINHDHPWAQEARATIARATGAAW